MMTNLKKLYARADCGIDQDGIHGLNLIELNACYNSKITDVSFIIRYPKTLHSNVFEIH